MLLLASCFFDVILNMLLSGSRLSAVRSVVRPGVSHPLRLCTRSFPATAKHDYIGKHAARTVKLAHNFSANTGTDVSTVPGTKDMPPLPSLFDAYRDSTYRDCLRWFAFASIFTGASIFACAIATNELSELALEDCNATLELYDLDDSLDEYIAKHGNAALRAVVSRYMDRLWDRIWFYPSKAIHAVFPYRITVTVSEKYSKFSFSQQSKSRKDNNSQESQSAESLETKARNAWIKEVDSNRLYPASQEWSVFAKALALTVLLRWSLAAALHLPSVGLVIKRAVPAHNIYSSRSYSLFTSIFRSNPERRGVLARFVDNFPMIQILMFFTLFFQPVTFVQDSDGSQSDLMEATSMGRTAALALTASVWGNAISSIKERLLGIWLVYKGRTRNSAIPSRVAGVHGAWAALATCAILTHSGDHNAPSASDEQNEAHPNLFLLSLLTPVIQSLGGAAVGVAYMATGQQIFDVARRATFSADRYPLLRRFQAQHAATAEERAKRASRYSCAGLDASKRFESPENNNRGSSR